MSELQDWKLKAQAVVKLCSKKCDKSVSLSVLSMTKLMFNKFLNLKLTSLATFTQNCIYHWVCIKYGSAGATRVKCGK